MARRPRRSSAETRAEILATAENLFRSGGYEKTSVHDIAATIGMSPANVFKHFPSKMALVEAIGEVERVANAIALSVDEQSRANSEIACQVRLSFDGAQRSADMAGGFETMTVETHGAAEKLQETAAALAQQAQSIRQDVALFCGNIAAA